MGQVEVAKKEQVAGDEAFQAAGAIGVVLVEVEVGEIVAGVGEAAGASAGAGGHDVGLLVVIGIDEVGFAGLEIDAAIAERGPDFDGFGGSVVIIVVAEFAAEYGFDAQADALAVVENPVEEFGELFGRCGVGEAFLVIGGQVGEYLKIGVAQFGEGRGGVIGLGAGGLLIEQVEGGALSGIPGVEEVGLDGFDSADKNDVGGGHLIADRHGQLTLAGEGREWEDDPEESSAAHALIIASIGIDSVDLASGGKPG